MIWTICLAIEPDKFLNQILRFLINFFGQFLAHYKLDIVDFILNKNNNKINKILRHELVDLFIFVKSEYLVLLLVNSY